MLDNKHGLYTDAIAKLALAMRADLGEPE